MSLDIWPGDTFASLPVTPTGGEQSLSALIVEATQEDEFPTPSHVFGAIDAQIGFEMTAPKGRRFLLDEKLSGGFLWWHLRWKGATDAERQAAADEALTFEGQLYGYQGLVWDGLDRLFHTRAVSQALGFDKILVCSAVWSRAWKDGPEGIGGRGRIIRTPVGKALLPSSVTPNDWVRCARAWPGDLEVLDTNLTPADSARALASWQAKVAESAARRRWAQDIAGMIPGP